MDSTNNYARGLIQSKEAGNGTAVLAYSQVKGRGQGGNSWESEPGKNLTVSFILEPHFLKSEKQFYLSMISALAAAGFFSQFTHDIRLKWPNDIYWKNRKAGGILIENSFLGNTFESSIIGFGLNINQEIFSSKAPNPVSLKQITGEYHDIDFCFELLARHLFLWFDKLKEGSPEIAETYNSLLYLKGKWSQFRSQGLIFDGQITDVDELGQLGVRKNDGSIHRYINREIEFIQ